MPRIIDVIEAPNQGPNDMVLRQPEIGSGDFRLGSQVIVRESQTAASSATARRWTPSTPAVTPSARLTCRS